MGGPTGGSGSIGLSGDVPGPVGGAGGADTSVSKADLDMWEEPGFWPEPYPPLGPLLIVLAIGAGGAWLMLAGKREEAAAAASFAAQGTGPGTTSHRPMQAMIRAPQTAHAVVPTAPKTSDVVAPSTVHPVGAATKSVVPRSKTRVTAGDVGTHAIRLSTQPTKASPSRSTWSPAAKVPRAGQCSPELLAVHLVAFIEAEGRSVPVKTVYERVNEAGGGGSLTKTDRSHFNKAMSRALAGKRIDLVGPDADGYLHRSVAPRRR